MEQKRTQECMVGNLLFNYLSQSERQKYLSSNDKSQNNEDPFIQKFLSFKSKYHSKASSLNSKSRSRQIKQTNKHLSASTICSSNYNNSTLQKSNSCCDISLIKNSKVCNIIKSKLHIRNQQQQLESVLLNNHQKIADDNNEQSFVNMNNSMNYVLGNENSNITQLPKINLRNIINRNTKGSKEYAHYFKLSDNLKERLIKTKMQLQENVFSKLRKEYCFFVSNKSKSSEKLKFKQMFDMAERNGNKVDYFHSGKSKKHIFKYRFKC